MAGKKKSKPKPKRNSPSNELYNFILDAAPGCHIAHYDAFWIIGVESFQLSDFECEDIPEICLDPDDNVLCVINTCSDLCKSFYITLTHGCKDAYGKSLKTGKNQDASGNITECLTFILTIRPLTIMRVCYLEVPESCPNGKLSIEDLDLDSDVHTIPPTSASSSTSTILIDFPFPPNIGPLLCTQGFGGELTHFVPNSHHAIDFRCPIGTPLVAVADGVVVDVRDGCTASGIHVRNLFTWNSVLLRLDSVQYSESTDAQTCSTSIEYVHLLAGSIRVAVGQRVRVGDVIASSGAAGFSPEPHLHLQVHASSDPSDPTIPFMFIKRNGETGDILGSFLPNAGQFLSASGIM
eukprot:GHVR01119309.1.p1 GENE.GHVR01119309.1~~GHVR01119309.1.p1  ORF type:complete len:351 (-),score=11.94 GHVR01119309.1:802-1854(-)